MVNGHILDTTSPRFKSMRIVYIVELTSRITGLTSKKLFEEVLAALPQGPRTFFTLGKVKMGQSDSLTVIKKDPRLFYDKYQLICLKMPAK